MNERMPADREHNDAERGRRIVESGAYAPPLGKYLGRIDAWGLDVFENSPQPWIDALLDEYRSQQHG
jgi:hypothetical protein